MAALTNYFTISLYNHNLPFFFLNLLASILIIVLFLSCLRLFKRSLTTQNAHFLISLSLIIFSAAAVSAIVKESIPKAIALFGIAAIVRYRTPVKSFVDSSLILVALAIGLLIGFANPLIAFIFIIVFSLLVFIVQFFFNKNSNSDTSFSLRFSNTTESPSEALSNSFLSKLSDAQTEVTSIQINNRHFSSKLNLETVTVDISCTKEFKIEKSFIDSIKKQFNGTEIHYEVYSDIQL